MAGDVLYVRWMNCRDLRNVMQTESEGFSPPWSEIELLSKLRSRNAIGMVSEVNDQYAGFMIYELHPHRIHLLRLAVPSRMRRIGVGTAMMARLKNKLFAGARNRIVVEVHERNTAAQLFFRHIGFRAISVVRDCYSDCTDDAYLFVYRHGADGAALSASSSVCISKKRSW